MKLVFLFVALRAPSLRPMDPKSELFESCGMILTELMDHKYSKAFEKPLIDIIVGQAGKVRA